MDLVYFTGTRRCREPVRTLEMIAPLLGWLGITRLADITGLDFLGVPVAQAVRPGAATVTVSQGKGATRAAALVSAAMEAIELSCAENAVPPAALTGPAGDLELGYQLADLDMGPGSLVTDRTVLDWIPARGALSGARFLVPRDLVWMGQRTCADWRIAMISGTSNGLAAGNSRAEAIAHACYELAERDDGAALAVTPVQHRRFLDLDTVPAGWCADLIARIQAAGGWLAAAAAPGRSGLACFAAWLWTEDEAGSLAAGAGAHADPQIALSRAITEAAQSRLTLIAGARDDISPGLYLPPGAPGRPPDREGRAEPWAEIAGGPGWPCRTDADEAAVAAGRLMQAAGAEPMVVDLLGQAELAVVKVLCPGLAFDHGHIPWQPPAAA
jgi:ribosomal protein S12 methylthiotransferase accessory factor